MAKSLWCAGNYNLRGKREKLMRCGCCTVTDLRPKLREREARKEMRDLE